MLFVRQSLYIQEYMYVLNLYVDILQSFYQQRKLKFEIDYEIPDKCYLLFK